MTSHERTAVVRSGDGVDRRGSVFGGIGVKYPPYQPLSTKPPKR